MREVAGQFPLTSVVEELDAEEDCDPEVVVEVATVVGVEVRPALGVVLVASPSQADNVNITPTTRRATMIAVTLPA